MLTSLRALALLAMTAIPVVTSAAPAGQSLISPPSTASVSGLYANGISLNGIKWNGVTLNGVTLNGIKWNGIVLNGIVLNGIVLNGIVLNGIVLNGIVLNGIVLNGVTLNGKFLNGTPFDGALSRRGFVSFFERDENASANADWSSLALTDVRVRLPLAR